MAHDHVYVFDPKRFQRIDVEFTFEALLDALLGLASDDLAARLPRGTHRHRLVDRAPHLRADPAVVRARERSSSARIGLALRPITERRREVVVVSMTRQLERLRKWEDAGCVVLGNENAGALFSRDMVHRYLLWRTFNGDLFSSQEARGALSICMLNPSTADHLQLDPTIRRVVDFASREGCGGVIVHNLFALRSTDPDELTRQALKGVDIRGPLNLDILREPGSPLEGVRVRVGAWGSFPSKTVRALAVDSIAQWSRSPYAVLGFTKGGEPRHPLFVPKVTPLSWWSKRT